MLEGGSLPSAYKSMAIDILIQFKKSPWDMHRQYSQKFLYFDPKARLGAGTLNHTKTHTSWVF